MQKLWLRQMETAAMATVPLKKSGGIYTGLEGHTNKPLAEAGKSPSALEETVLHRLAPIPHKLKEEQHVIPLSLSRSLSPQPCLSHFSVPTHYVCVYMRIPCSSESF
jgi:hypothetical protein